VEGTDSGDREREGSVKTYNFRGGSYPARKAGRKGWGEGREENCFKKEKKEEKGGRNSGKLVFSRSLIFSDSQGAFLSFDWISRPQYLGKGKGGGSPNC